MKTFLRLTTDAGEAIDQLLAEPGNRGATEINVLWHDTPFEGAALADGIVLTPRRGEEMVVECFLVFDDHEEVLAHVADGRYSHAEKVVSFDGGDMGRGNRFRRALGTPGLFGIVSFEGSYAAVEHVALALPDHMMYGWGDQTRVFPLYGATGGVCSHALCYLLVRAEDILREEDVLGDPDEE